MEDKGDFVPHAAELLEDFFIGPGGVGGVVESPVIAVYLAGEHGAGLIGVAADGDDGIDLLPEEFVHVLGVVATDVDADFGHGGDGLRVNVASRLRACALDVEDVPCGLAEDSLGHVAAAGVSGAEDEDGGFHERVGFC